MKLKSTLSTLLLLALVTSLSFGQSEHAVDSIRKNDISIDPIFLIAVPLLNIAYERLVSADMGVGVNGVVGLDELNEGAQISPFVRMYFGQNYASGFFLEAFVPVTSFKEEVYYDDGNGYYSNSRELRHTTVGLGVGLGGKWVLKRNLLFELGGGIARRFGHKGDSEALTGKWMVGVGYRF